MSLQLARRLALVKPSATLALNAKAIQLQKEGKDIINLSVGEPDFDTPGFIKAAAIQALEAGFTKYTAVQGILELRQAICQKLKTDNQLSYTPEQVIVSTGLKQSLYNAMQVLLNPGDEVLILAPYWVSYPEMVYLAEGVPVIVESDLVHGLKVTAPALEKAITPRTKMVLLNSPSNPSGVVYGQKDLAPIAEVLRQHPNIIIATDDMYEKMYWGKDPFVNILNVAPDLYDRTIVFNGFSKTYAMTGWRLGYAAGPREIIQAMSMVQSQSTSSANSFVQKAGVAALLGSQACVREMAEAFHARYNFLHAAFSAMPGVQVPKAEGAFYCYPYVQAWIDQLGVKDDVALCDVLLEKAGVAVLPGSTCGTPGFVRLSFATSMENLEKAVERLRGMLFF